MNDAQKTFNAVAARFPSLSNDHFDQARPHEADQAAPEDSTFASGLVILACIVLIPACLYGWALNGQKMASAYYDGPFMEFFWRAFGAGLPPVGALMGYFW